MKCQILFSRKNKKNIINLSSAELAQRVVKGNIQATNKRGYPHFFSYFSRKTCCGYYYKLEALLMSTHKIGFCREIRKLSIPFG